MDTNKKLKNLKKEFNATINHATEVLEEYVNTLTEKIFVDTFNELSVENQMRVLLGMFCETQQDLYDDDQNRRERWQEHEEDIQERLNRHIDEAIDKVISKKQERNRLLRLLNQNQIIMIL